MKSLSEQVGETLVIHQPSVWKSYFELKYGKEVLGTTCTPNIFGFSKIFRIGNIEWRIYQTSIWKSEIAIKQIGHEIPCATFKKQWFKNEGTVNLLRGERFIIEYKNFTSICSVKDTSGEYLITFIDNISLKKEKTEILINKKSPLLDENPWVIGLAWYLSSQRAPTFLPG